MLVEPVTTTLHHGTAWWRRIWAVAASSLIGVVMGAVLATMIAGGVAWTVITLTRLLRN